MTITSTPSGRRRSWCSCRPSTWSASNVAPSLPRPQRPREGPERGLALIEEVGRAGPLEDYLHFHSARADLLRRLGRITEARAAYLRAFDLAGNTPERDFLRRRLDSLAAG